MSTFYDECMSLGIASDFHESDMYVPVNEQTTTLLSKYGLKAKKFVSQIDGKAWYDVPFANMKWWRQRSVL